MTDIRNEIDNFLIERYKDHKSVHVETIHDDCAIVFVNDVHFTESYDVISLLGLSRFMSDIDREIQKI